jgi:hypothetical protein
MFRMAVVAIPPKQQAELQRIAVMVQHRVSDRIVAIACIKPGEELRWVSENEIRYPRSEYRMVIGVVSILGELLGIDAVEGDKDGVVQGVSTSVN